MRRVALLLASVMFVLSYTPRVARAQEVDEKAHEKPAADKSASPDQHAKPSVQPFRLDFSFYELEGGKKINTRRYSLDLTAGSRNELRIGTRVPVPTGNDGLMYQYMDVGTKIWANLSMEGGGDLRIDVTSDVSNLDTPETPARGPNVHPVVRQIQINGTTLLVPGKPTLIGSVDDPNSNRQFQLEVTATKLR